MSKMFRLKKEAVPFFKKELANEVRDWDFWSSKNIDNNALEEVKAPYLTYGHVHEHSEKGWSSKSNSGWSSPETNGRNGGARYYFTLHFPSSLHDDCQVMSEDRSIRRLMDDIQELAEHWSHLVVNERRAK